MPISMSTSRLPGGHSPPNAKRPPGEGQAYGGSMDERYQTASPMQGEALPHRVRAVLDHRPGVLDVASLGGGAPDGKPKGGSAGDVGVGQVEPGRVDGLEQTFVHLVPAPVAEAHQAQVY